jgi:hypothetical protein
MHTNFQSFNIVARSTEHVSGLTHNYYKYPARFSPSFARKAIETYTNQGDLVLDPFVGGGTTLVEASSIGRRSVGIDINSLAIFISKVKTTSLSQQEIQIIRKWGENIPYLTIQSNFSKPINWIDNGYLRNINDKYTWRIRNIIEVALTSIMPISNENISNFIRCVVLKTGQWALDGRSIIPSVDDFRLRLYKNIDLMLGQMEEYSSNLRWDSKQILSEDDNPLVKIINRSAIGLENESIFTDQPPKLILMSPPYPGVHVLYHRWQIFGRRETPAPFWIANQSDGQGASHYTFGSRKSHQNKQYFNDMQKVFNSLANISDKETTIVQMIAFSNPRDQLPRYLRLMNNTGFQEVFLSTKKTHKRIWRKVPNRKWYADVQGDTPSSKEVILIHKLLSEPI